MALYGESQLGELLAAIESIIDGHLAASESGAPPEPLSERDVLLIAYGDQVREQGRSPLQTLAALLNKELAGLVSGIHILPFFPSSSDDGFSVIDYREVDPALGTWEDIHLMAAGLRLMLDAVVNHVSSQSDWFQAFLRGDGDYQDSFVQVEPSADLSKVVRPRNLPLLTRFDTALGERHLWTTFSADQIDLNYANPQVMLHILDLLLFYVRQGAQLIRLDAVAFLWKEIGTSSIHHPKTHHAVKLMRAVLDAAAPGTIVVTETNVPHEENLSYFGEGDEAHMVYQFALPPLVLHTLTTGNVNRLALWASDLRLPGDGVTFLNFLASHDGIGLRPVAGLLSEDELGALAALPERSGGTVSYRALSNGRQSPYELNLTYLDALTDPLEFDLAPQRASDRFIAAHAIMLAMPGLPAIYLHSLFGSRNDLAGVRQTGRPRSINREKLELSVLIEDLEHTNGLRHRIFRGLSRLLRARAAHPAFDPWSGLEVRQTTSKIFEFVREHSEAGRVVCLHEVAGREVQLEVSIGGASGYDLIAKENIDPSRVHLKPYQPRWITIES